MLNAWISHNFYSEFSNSELNKSNYHSGFLLMELSPFWEAANCAALQELPSSLWNSKVHYRVHKNPQTIFSLWMTTTKRLKTLHNIWRNSLFVSFWICILFKDCRWEKNCFSNGLFAMYLNYSLPTVDVTLPILGLGSSLKALTRLKKYGTESRINNHLHHIS
jgi:hypothetical protein